MTPIALAADPRRPLAARLALGLLRGAFALLRYAVLVVLVALRGPLDFLLSVAGLVCFLGIFVLWTYQSGTAALAMAGACFACAAIRVSYESALDRLRYGRR